MNWWKRLPPELIDGIFEHLHQNKRLLKACSLVCKAWLHPAYRLLFYDTRLTCDQLRTAFYPRSESISAPFIRRLHIVYTSQENETLPSLDGFHLVTSLAIESIYWNLFLPHTQSTISNRFITITRLELRGVVFDSFSQFAEMICTFRCLEALILGSIDWCREDTVSSLLHLPQRLHALELDNSDLTEIVKWLCSFGQNLTLHNLYLMGPWHYQSQAIDTLLQVLGPSLETIRIRLVERILPICLRHNTHLRFLHLDVQRGHERQTGLASVLSTVVSEKVEWISLSLLHTRDWGDGIFHDSVPREWGEVDTILARPHFSNLKTLSVRGSRHGSDVEHPLEWFVDRLPLCHQRGVLRSCETMGPFM